MRGCGRVVFFFLLKEGHNNASALRADSPSGDQEFESPHPRFILLCRPPLFHSMKMISHKNFEIETFHLIKESAATHSQDWPAGRSTFEALAG
jgi:hypothetical protein